MLITFQVSHLPNAYPHNTEEFRWRSFRRSQKLSCRKHGLNKCRSLVLCLCQKTKALEISKTINDHKIPPSFKSSHYSTSQILSTLPKILCWLFDPFHEDYSEVFSMQIFSFSSMECYILYKKKVTSESQNTKNNKQ